MSQVELQCPAAAESAAPIGSGDLAKRPAAAAPVATELLCPHGPATTSRLET